MRGSVDLVNKAFVGGVGSGRIRTVSQLHPHTGRRFAFLGRPANAARAAALFCPRSKRDHAPVTPSNEVLTTLLDQAATDHTRWIRGDATGYALPDDGTILGAVGGWARGGSETSERQASVAAHWSRGTGHLEFLNGGTSGDVAWLTFIERSHVVFRGEQRERRWDLRVTEIFRRNGTSWQRVHRHADPLVDRRPVTAAADLLSDM